MRRISLLSFGIAILIVLIVVKFDFSDLIIIVTEKISLLFYILLCFVICGQLLFRAFRFYFLFNNSFEDKIAFWDSFLLTSASYFIALATPNKVGDTLRGLFLKRQQLEVTAISLIEYLFDILILLIIPVFGVFILYHIYFTEIVIGYGALALALVILLVLLKFFNPGIILNKFNLYTSFKDKLKLLKKHFKESLKSKYALALSLLFTCLFFGLFLMVFHIVLQRMGAHTTALETIAAAGMGVFIGALTFIPMGMGTRDASSYGILVSLGTDPEIAMSSVIIMRSLSLPLILVSGFCYFTAIRQFDVSQAG